MALVKEVGPSRPSPTAYTRIMVACGVLGLWFIGFGFGVGMEARPRPVLTNKPIEPPRDDYRVDLSAVGNPNVDTTITMGVSASGAGTNIGLHASAYGGVNNHAALFDGDVVIKGKLIMEGYKCVPTE